MGSSVGHEQSNVNQGNSNSIADADTQAFDIDSPSSSSSSGEKFKDGMADGLCPFQRVMAFEETLVVENEFLFETELAGDVTNLDGETQMVEDPDCFDGKSDDKGVATQIMYECEGDASDIEGTERTEVLSDDDGLSDDGTTPCKVKDFESERKIKDDGQISLEKRRSCSPLCSRDQGMKDVVPDFDASTDDDCNSVGHCDSSASLLCKIPTEPSTAEPSPGSVRRSFTSVRAASLRSSGLAATRSLTPKRTDIVSTPTQNVQAGQKQSNVIVHQPDTDSIQKDTGMTTVRDSTFIDTRVSDLDKGHEIANSQDKLKDEDGGRTKNMRVRKLFFEDTAVGTVEQKNNTDNVSGDAVSPRLLVCDHAVAGLSYVDSQEPGEMSQANALNMVDKFLSFNDVDVSREVDTGKILSGTSLPLSTSAKGTHSLAKRADIRNQVGKRGIFDWIDSCEDEGGGDFFNKRKEVFFENKNRVQKSLTEIRKSRHRSFGRSGQVVNKLGEKEERTSAQIHQRILGLAHSDSRLLSHGPIKVDKIQVSETNINKNLFKAFGESLNAEPSEGELETPDAGRVSPDIYDVGIDTQLAAEAMEALVCGPPANLDFGEACPATGFTEGGTKSKARSKSVSISNTEGVVRRTKQRKVSETTISRENPVSSKKHLKNSRRKGQEAKVKSKANREKLKHEKSSQFKGGKMGDAMGGNFSIEVHSSGAVTPVACRTRKSSKRTDRTEASIHGRKSSGNKLGVIAPEPLVDKDKFKTLKLDADQIGKLRKDKLNKPVLQGIDGLHEEEAKISSIAIDALSYPKGKRTRRNSSGNFSNAVGSKYPFMVPEGDAETSTRRRRLKTDFRSAFMSSDRVSRTTSSPAMDKFPLSSLATDLLPKQRDEVALTSASSLPSPKVQSSVSACASPSKEINVVSPSCAGDDAEKELCRKGSLKSPLTRELIRLGATEATRAPVVKDLRRRRDMISVRVLFSHHLDEDVIKQQKKILARLGVSIASSSLDATHFIADKFARTRNMLETMALGKPVVTHLWLESCGQANCFIDEKNYIMRDPKKEKEIGFSMPVSLARSCQNPLLQGKKVFITPNIKPDREMIASLVKAVHGEAVERIGRSAMKDDKIPDDLLVISCDEDYKICVPLLEKEAGIYSPELILNGIVIQKLEYERHRLFVDRVKSTRFTTWLRNEDGDEYRPVIRRK